jgi:hypothetical protein
MGAASAVFGNASAGVRAGSLALSNDPGLFGMGSGAFMINTLAFPTCPVKLFKQFMIFHKNTLVFDKNKCLFNKNKVSVVE